jgi:hypothetical protein
MTYIFYYIIYYLKDPSIKESIVKQSSIFFQHVQKSVRNKSHSNVCRFKMIFKLLNFGILRTDTFLNLKDESEIIIGINL